MNRKTVNVGFLSLATLIVGLTLSFVGVFVVDPADNDGLFGNIAILASPALVFTVIISLMIDNSTKGVKSKYPKWFYFIVFGLFPLSYFGIFLGAAINNPDYFAPERDGGLPMACVLFFLIFGFAAVSGYLLWFAIVFPISLIVGNIKATLKGEKIGVHHYALPVGILVGSAFVTLSGAAIDAEGVGRGAGLTILFAVFGLPGAYDIRSEGLLWAGRAVVLLVILSYVGWRLLASRAEENSKA